MLDLIKVLCNIIATGVVAFGVAYGAGVGWRAAAAAALGAIVANLSGLYQHKPGT